jgi:hypothetical protein
MYMGATGDSSGSETGDNGANGQWLQCMGDSADSDDSESGDNCKSGDRCHSGDSGETRW